LLSSIKLVENHQTGEKSDSSTALEDSNGQMINNDSKKSEQSI